VAILTFADFPDWFDHPVTVQPKLVGIVKFFTVRLRQRSTAFLLVGERRYLAIKLPKLYVVTARWLPFFGLVRAYRARGTQMPNQAGAVASSPCRAATMHSEVDTSRICNLPEHRSSCRLGFEEA
jgi:hypothetical protein